MSVMDGNETYDTQNICTHDNILDILSIRVDIQSI